MNSMNGKAELKTLNVGSTWSIFTINKFAYHFAVLLVSMQGEEYLQTEHSIISK